MSLKIEDGQLYLRKLSVQDATLQYYHWLQDEEVTKFLEIRFLDNSLDEIRQYILDTNSEAANLFLAICLKKNDSHIGNIKLGPIDSHHGFSPISLFIGDKSCWGKGYATKAITLLSRYAFESLNLNKIISGCYEPNIGSRKAFEKAGFTLEGVQKKQYLFEDQWVDCFCFGLLKEEFDQKKRNLNDE